MKSFAMVFPGQGSQSIGMLSNLYEEYSEIKNYFYQASSILKYDLWNLIKNGCKEELNKTWKTQPAILTASVAIYNLWIKKSGMFPKIMTGHSLGEYSALVCAKAIDFSQAIQLVELRGKLMQRAVSNRSTLMNVILGLKYEVVMKICKNISNNKIVEITNFNTPTQIVISGDKEAVEEASKKCKSIGAKKVITLQVSVPAHCTLMKLAKKSFFNFLKKINFKSPFIPVISSTDVTLHSSPKNICNSLLRNLYTPVQWVDCINLIKKKNIFNILEIGPGTILTNLIKKIENTIKVFSINSKSELITIIKKYKME